MAAVGLVACSGPTFSAAPVDAASDMVLAEAGADVTVGPDAPMVDAGHESSNGEAAATCDADVSTDPVNCGACGHDCLGASCQGGVCAAVELIGGLTNPQEMVLTAGLAFITVGGPCMANGDCPDGSITRVPMNPDAGPATTLASPQDTPRGIATDGVNVYWGDYNTTAEIIRSLPIGAGMGTPPTDVTASAAGAYEIAVSSTRLYWISNGGTVSSQPFGGPVLTGMLGSHPGDMFIDAMGTAFWTVLDDGMSGPSIASGSVGTVSGLTGGPPATHVLSMSEGKPMGIAVSPTGEMVWADNLDGTIRRMGQGGGVAQTFVTGQKKPVRVAIDAGFVYWTNAGDGSVMRADVASATPVPLAVGGTNPVPLAISGGNLYWLDRGTWNMADGKLMRVAK